LAQGALEKAQVAYQKGLAVEPALGALVSGMAKVKNATEVKKAAALANLAAWKAEHDAPQKPQKPVPKRKHEPEEPAPIPSPAAPTSRANRMVSESAAKKRPPKPFWD